MKALILVNGELYKPDVLRKRLTGGSFDLVIGADAGAWHAIVLGLKVDVIIGDMDSLSDLSGKDFGNARLIRYPAEKDETDLELALLYAKDKGADKIVMIGTMGGRMEMTVANILLLTLESLKSSRVEIWHGDQTGWIIRPPGENVSGYPGDAVSLLPLNGPASGVSTEGLKYPLNNARLVPGPARGVSNVMQGPFASIKLSEGLLLAVQTRIKTLEGR